MIAKNNDDPKTILYLIDYGISRSYLTERGNHVERGKD